MKESTPEENRQENHDYLLGFLNKTAGLTDELAESMKATICQFMHIVGNKCMLKFITNEPEPEIYESEIYELQINSLRQCVIDLEECLNRCLTGVTKQ